MDVRWHNFIWDKDKERRNIGLRGVTFKEAALATTDPLAVYGTDEIHSGRELREWLGQSPKKRLLLVVYARQESEIIRIITAWKAGQEDQKLYDEENTP